MKKYTLVLLLLSACLSCGRSISVHTDCVSLCIDITDTLKEVEQLTARQITPFLTVLSGTDHLFNGAVVRISSIGDMRMTETQTLRMPAQNPNEGTDIERNREAKAYTQKLMKAFADVKSHPRGRTTSMVFEKLAMELQKLVECSECSTKTLICTSDLRQNNAVLNTYDLIKVGELKMCAPCFDSIFAGCSFPSSLQGISIYFVHAPLSPEDDEIFFLIATGLKRNMERRGATVYVTGNLEQ